MKIALALGGGGARGTAHIGVIRALERHKIDFDFIAGTSMGAVVGASYCLTKDINWVEEKILKLTRTKEIMDMEKLSAPNPGEEKRILIEELSTFVKGLYLWNIRAIKRWIVDNAQMETVIDELVQEKNFDDLKLPFYAACCDLNTGEEVTIEKGKIKTAVLASIAIPGVFSPVEREGRILVDGGIINLAPISSCKGKNADFIIAVNVEENITPRKFKNGMEIIFQSDLITQYELNRLKLREADFVINPDVSNISWAQFSASERCIENGYEAGEKAVFALKTLISEKRKSMEKKKGFGAKLLSILHKES